MHVSLLERCKVKMNENDIRKYAALMKELELTGLEFTDEDNKVIRLERAITVVPTPQTVNVSETPAAPAAASEPQQGGGDDYISVKSPIVGVFYAAPTENGEPFVRLGDHVEKGETLCIVEAMKLMNEIYADEAGVIEKICVTNGQVVEYGTELFRIKR